MLGFGVSDFMVHRPLGPDGPASRIDFMHCDNARHHSLALLEGEVPADETEARESDCVHSGRRNPRMRRSRSRVG